jgi:hypothetical protein
MKSILYQLEKYNPASDNIKVTVPESLPEHGCEDALWELACKIVNPQHSNRDQVWRFAVQRVAHMLADMPSSPFANILFSKEILGIYHCYYNHQTQVASEDCTDQFFMSFLRQTDPREYQKKFEESVDSTAKRLSIIRVALATSEQHSLNIFWSNPNSTNSYGETYTHKKQDELPLEFRESAFEYLGISSISAAADLQERLTKHATLDQIILGRMGYMMFWSWNNRGERSNIPLLSAPRKALLPPRVICLPAPCHSRKI